MTNIVWWFNHSSTVAETAGYHGRPELAHPQAVGILETNATPQTQCPENPPAVTLHQRAESFDPPNRTEDRALLRSSGGA